ncbi:hypothetical protein GCM10007857_67890 [Bradyrhizobium iriomotense]|uniref:Uncharacterized protein n=1 Tax=Bradyrhizobium iriomotense TaxID=441950 RepID=A0ABQ6B8S7_9BRAD|nr:hypothetical protein GCM10007857_67890 [Bradyrhizobium iriomotense]
MDDTVAAHARNLLSRGVSAAIEKPRVVVHMIVVSAVVIVVTMILPVFMMVMTAKLVMLMMFVMSVFDGRLGVVATADRTHQATSNVFTRISSPPVTCN